VPHTGTDVADQETMLLKNCSLPTLFRVAASMLTIVGVAPVIAQEEASDARFGEVVEVQLVNVEAWVTDGKGNPVLGLTMDDFDLLEDGKPVEITYFSEIGAEKLKAIVESPPQEEKAPLPFTLEPPAENPNLSPAYLVLYFDEIHLTAPSRKRLIKDVRPFLDSGVVDPERVLILTQGQDLYTEANFGSDRIALEQALARIVKSGTSGTITEQEKRLAIGRLQLLWEEIQNVPTRGADPCDLFVQRARGDVEVYARMAANRILITLENLNNVSSFLGGVPGVKTLIYVSDALEMSPGPDVRRVVEELCPGRPEPYQYTLPDSMNAAFLEMTRSANANRVTFYAMQPSGLRADFLTTAETRGGSFLQGTTLISGLLRESDRSGMNFVATETGGQAVFNKNSFEKDFVRIGQEMTTYYSLAYTPPHGGDRGDHEIKVRIKGRDNLKVRHRRGYRDKGAEERLNDRLFTSLFLGLSENPLEARLGAGAMTPVNEKRFALPLHILVPAEKLTFMPQQAGSLAGVTVEVAAKDPEKAKVFRTRTTFEIPEPVGETNPLIDLVMSLELEKGQWVLAVAVRDEVTQETSYVSTAIEMSPQPAADPKS